MSLLALLALTACDRGGDDTASIVSPLDPDVLPVVAGDWLRPGPRTTWELQLEGTPTHDADVYVVDLFDTSAPTIASLRTEQRSVWCWFSAGTHEPGRDDAGAFPPEVRGRRVDDDADARWLDVRRTEVHDAMEARLDLAASKGCDGVAPADVDAWTAETGFPATATDQRAYNRFLFNGAHTRGLAVALVNDGEQVPELVGYVDVAVVEACHEQGVCATWSPFQTAVKPVWNAEYAAIYADDPAAFCRTALIAGTRSLVLSPALDGSFRVSCDTDFPATTRLAGVVTYTTYYERDPAAIDALASLDLAIVQPLLTADQRAALQARGRLAVYLSIGEIGLTNTYVVGGVEVLGQTIYDANPTWFRDRNPFFDSYFADANQPGWQDFVLGQADLLLALGYDGIFMDTVDTVDVYPDTIPGMVTLIGRLRDAHPDAVLVQNRGINVIPQSGPDVDALMFEVFSTTYNSDQQAYVPTDTAAPGYAELVEKAVDYRLTGGVVLAQDFGEPGDDALVCYAHERALAHRFVPSYADKFFQLGRFPWPAACPWPEEPRLGIAAEPRVGHLSRGRTVDVDLVLDGDSGFDAATTLAIGAPPAGITAALIDDDVPGVLRLTAASDAPLGTGVLEVTATSGDASQTLGLRIVVHDQTVWVTNAGLSYVVAFDEPDALTPTSPPGRRSGLVAQPYAIAVAADGVQWVVENVGDPTAAQPAGRLLRFAPFALDAPDLVVDSGLSYPTGVAIDADGTVWVANSALDWTGAPHGTPDVATVSGTAATLALSLTPGSLGYPRQIAFDDAGDLWMTTTYGLVLGYDVGAGSTAPPFTVIAGVGGASGLFDTVNGLTFDDAGDLWLSGSLAGVARVVRVPEGTWTTDGLTTVLDPTEAGAVLTDGLHDPWGLAWTPTGLWVVDATDAVDDASSRGALLRFTSLATGAQPSLVLPMESRYTLGIAVARP